jgi:hypothetical protein
MGDVSGSVTLNGEPVKEAVIRFTSSTARSARGKVVNGQIVSVTTFDTDDGVPVGNHRVVVQPAYAAVQDMGPDARMGPLRPVCSIPARYAQLSSTPLTAEVKKGKNEFTFELEKK